MSGTNAATPPRTARRFSDRREAGRALARALSGWKDDRPVVVALPRGGVPVGYEVARALDAPLDIGLVRKLGAPAQPEYGIGAIGEGGEAIVDPDAVRRLHITNAQLKGLIETESRELERRRRAYRHAAPMVDVTDRVAIVVDDGLATGATATAAARVLRARGAKRVVLAVPVCPASIGKALRSEFDEVVCLATPRPFLGVGSAYDDFDQIADEEVIDLLAAAHADAGIGAAPDVVEREITITRGPISLPGDLRIPPNPVGLVLFSHGSGSTRRSPRNRAVAAQLNSVGIATLLFDLLMPAETANRRNVFDVDLLSARLLLGTLHATADQSLEGLPIGLFGSSTGAAAALRVAATIPDRVAAVVSRGGRPDLAAAVLPRVVAPTLLIVGGADHDVLELNRAAAARLGGRHELAVIPGAGHLFEEPGALDEVARLASAWFVDGLGAAGEVSSQ